LASLAGGNNIEVIVVDGGSTDNTVQLAKASAMVNVVGFARGGRAIQLNAGAVQATGRQAYLSASPDLLIRQVLFCCSYTQTHDFPADMTT